VEWEYCSIDSWTLWSFLVGVEGYLGTVVLWPCVKYSYRAEIEGLYELSTMKRSAITNPQKTACLNDQSSDATL
jgi:hypothetical protein